LNNNEKRGRGGGEGQHLFFKPAALTLNENAREEEKGTHTGE
jgi:hypothetical protein